jgi:hypothetical protein
MLAAFLVLLPVILAGTGSRRAAVVRATEIELLRNGRLEEYGPDGRPAGWSAYAGGFEAAEGEGREGSRAVACQNDAPPGASGARQTLLLHRDVPRALVVSGWSRCRDVDGAPDDGYALYVDVEFSDGTALFGQYVGFTPGTHDWERRELLVPATKPVRSVSVYALFRGHSGRVWFDDLSVREVRGPGGAPVFEGVPVEPRPLRPSFLTPRRAVASGDGLALVLSDGLVVSVRAGGRALPPGGPSGFIARDVAAGSDFVSVRDGACPELGLALQAEFEERPDHLSVRGVVRDAHGRDRALTLLFALPVDATGWRWHDDLRRSRAIEAGKEYVNAVSGPSGATGTLSLYPLAAISSDREGLAIGVDMAFPAQVRLAYHAGTRQFYVAYDFGLIPDSRPRRGAAEFRFVLYRFPPRWGFRAALARYYGLFPESFARRAHESGTWLPFGDAGRIPNWEDFGFKYHEGHEQAAADDGRRLLSFRYTEPLAAWMPLPPGTPRTEEEALRVLRESPSLAPIVASSGMAREDGRKALLFRDAPWCDGAVWSLNPCPHLAGTDHAAASLWNDEVRHSVYGERAPGRVDGEFVDSVEGYLTADLDFDREHLRRATVPLTFASRTHRPALLKTQAAAEYLRWLATELRRLDRLVFANGTPHRVAYLCPWIDVLGTERDWMPEGRFRPPPDAEMAYWRSMAFQKPFLLLLNTDFDRLTPAHGEAYFRRCLFYGFFPSMFSRNASDDVYWNNPAWYERDRPLFRKYVPLIRRVASAGWHPVPLAEPDNDRILAERFGPDASGVAYVTLLNERDTEEETAVRLLADGVSEVTDILAGKALPIVQGQVFVRLGPGEVRLLELR